jgi:hypothetical protein
MSDEATRKAALDQIDAEIARLQSISTEKIRAAEADEQQHLSQWNHGLQRRLREEAAKVDKAVNDLLARRADVELGVAERPVAAASSRYDPIDLGTPDPSGIDDEKLANAIRRTDVIVRDMLQGMKFDEHHARRPPSLRFALQMITHLRIATRESLEARDKAIEALTARQDALEEHGVRYSGVWQRSLAYPKGSVVTDAGAMWVALQPVEGVRPGESVAHWQLCAKSEFNIAQRQIEKEKLALQEQRADLIRREQALIEQQKQALDRQAEQKPKRKKTKTTVTKHDSKGRVREFIQEDVEQ